MHSSNTKFQHKGRTLLLAGLSALTLLGSAVSATRAYARPSDGHGWSTERMEHRTDRMLRRVNATAEQQTKIHAIIEAASKDITPIRDSLRGTHEKLRALLAAPQIDTAAIEALRGQRSAAMDQISRRMTSALEDAANVLTPDQRQKLAVIDTDRGMHHHRH
jgi:Spy/CpxP family protein refolding chaperone